MNSTIKAVLITFAVMGLILGTIAGLGEFRKYENSVNPPAPYDTGRCDNADCMQIYERTPEQQKAFDDWVKSQSPIHSDKPLG